MLDLEKLKSELDNLFRPIINRPIDFEFVLGICEYVKYIQNSPVLLESIEKQHKDLRKTRYSIPKAVTRRESELMSHILDEKLYINCSEDFQEIEFCLEALNNLRVKTPADDMANIQIRMEYDLWELEHNQAKQKNYYIQHSQKLKRCLNKVHRYLIGELWTLEEAEEKQKGFTEQGSRFDEQTGTLYINGLPVEIKSQNRITDQYRIIKYIFSSLNLRDDFFYTEIAEGILDQDFKLSRYTTACEKIQKKIADKLDIKDYLNFNYSQKQGKVSINPKYLA